MFKPTELIFAPTGRCNLHCTHCRVNRNSGELDINSAKSFLESCADAGIDKLGFSGGEPFLRPDFLIEIIKSAIDNNMFFDRLMTNGVFWETENELMSIIEGIFEAGFDGTIGLSYDYYHGQKLEKLVTFLNAVFKISGRKDCVEILTVRSEKDEAFLSNFHTLAKTLKGKLELIDSEPARIAENEPFEYKHTSTDYISEDTGARLYINVLLFPYSAEATEGTWTAKHWFKDDYCEGPGQLFYVHPDGSVAVCCGFANERPELKIGTIHDSAAKLLEKAAGNPYVITRYEAGLLNTKKALEAKGIVFPGKTMDQCFFCDYLCNKGLA